MAVNAETRAKETTGRLETAGVQEIAANQRLENEPDHELCAKEGSVVAINAENKAKETMDGLETAGAQEIAANQRLRMNRTMSFARKR